MSSLEYFNVVFAFLLCFLPVIPVRPLFHDKKVNEKEVYQSEENVIHDVPECHCLLCFLDVPLSISPYMFQSHMATPTTARKERAILKLSTQLPKTSGYESRACGKQ
jgi:hypothetical protein